MAAVCQEAEHKGLVVVTWRSAVLPEKMLDYIVVRWEAHRMFMPKHCCLFSVSGRTGPTAGKPRSALSEGFLLCDQDP